MKNDNDLISEAYLNEVKHSRSSLDELIARIMERAEEGEDISSALYQLAKKAYEYGKTDGGRTGYGELGGTPYPQYSDYGDWERMRGYN